jgi:predicted metal-dependent hydrolase
MKARTHRTASSLEISGVGRIGLKRNHRARHLNLTVKPFKGVQVTVPTGIPLDQVKQFVLSKKGWIAKHLERTRALERKRIQAAEALEGVDFEKGADTLVRELNKLAARHGFRVRKVTVRNQKTRWGSCSADNCISLNINLIHLPLKLLYYVLLHELLHTRIKNHSREFWNELDHLIGNAKALRAQLHEFGYLLLRD